MCGRFETAEQHQHRVLTFGRNVGAKEKEDDSKPFKEKMSRLVTEPHTQFAKSAKLQQAIKVKLTHHIYVLTEISAA